MNPTCVLTNFIGLISLAAQSFGEAQIDGLSINPDDATFDYYAEPTHKQEIICNNRESLAASSLKKQANTVIIIDGFLSNGSFLMSQPTKNAFLATDRYQNVIILNWGKLSGNDAMLKGRAASLYLAVIKNVGPLGEQVAEFVRFLQTNAHIPPNKVEIVGHSLGAHIAGAAGFWFNKRYSQKISRITGLDPAGPRFSKQVDSQKRLDQSDADFVAIYHTNRGRLGDMSHDTGHINVYVNDATKQPGCERLDSSSLAGLCSHSFSWKLFNACFNGTFTACPCSGVLQCQCNYCNFPCANPITLGYATAPSARGAYHVKTGTL